MQTLEEAIKMANEEVETYSPINATSDEGYTYVDGYERYDEYTETQEIVVLDRDVGDISEQISIKGESLSQYILFKINRHYDGIDLTEKKIRIHYELSDGTGSEDDAINVRYNDTDIKFGWAIPEYATRNAGIIKVFIWVYGTAPNGEDYILKTKTLDYEILDSQNIGEGIVQPDENWYTSFVRQITVYVEQAKASENKAKQSETNAKASETKTLEYKNSVEKTVGNFNTTVEQSLVQINAAKSDALTSISTLKDEANTSIQNTKASVITQIQTEATTQKNAIVQEGTKQVGLVKAAGEEVTESVDQIWKNELYSRHRATGIMLEASGTGDVEIQDSTDSKMEIELYGKMEQVVTTGAQLFDASRIATTSVGGATVTNNGDGSFTISGSGNLSENFKVNYKYSHLDSIKILSNKAGLINIKFEKTTYPYCYMLFNADRYLGEVDNASSGATKFEITEEMLNNENFYIEIGFNGTINSTIVPGTIKPMLYQDGDGTYEPYTGGSPAPSPDYPQVIKGVGGMGYFDGILLQGSYNQSGVIVNDANAVCNANKIKCKQGDKVDITYEGNDGVIHAVLFKDGMFVKNAGAIAEGINITDDANEFGFYITKYPNPFPLSEAKHISVTINGKYATEVETQGRNLAEVTQTNKNQVYNGVTLKLNDDGSYTLNGTCTKTDVFRLNQPDGSDTPNYPVICKLKAGTKYRITGSQILVRNSTSPNINAMSNDIFYTPTEDTDVIGIRVLITQGTTYSSTKTYYPGIWEDPDETRTEWVPFKRTSLTIPLTSPLYEGDKICYVKPGESYVNAEGETVVADRILYGVYRENAVVVFDGSEDESWTKDDALSNLFYTLIANKIGAIRDNDTSRITCNKLITLTTLTSKTDMTADTIKETGTEGSNAVYVNIPEAGTTVESLRTWLSTNPLTVVYKLATPYFEPFVDQTEIYNLFTIDSYTRVVSKEKETIPDLKVEYITDTKKYIDKKVSEAITQAITIAQA